MTTEEREMWKPVKGYESLYEINESGDVRSLHKHNYGYILNQRIDRGGYYTVRLSKPYKRSCTFYVHRLLGYAFIPNPENKPFINHKSGIKLNNSIDNLEWVTHSENMLHAYKLNLIKLQTRKVIDFCSGEIYNSIKQASKACHINYNTLRNYLSGWNSNPTCLSYAA